jgi:hypothetical protein
MQQVKPSVTSCILGVIVMEKDRITKQYKLASQFILSHDPCDIAASVPAS